MILGTFSAEFTSDPLFIFVSAYWHLVEVVWIVILFSLCSC
jgi:heme/copper-type cytochrome/quinol oxidase subunit 3